MLRKTGFLMLALTIVAAVSTGWRTHLLSAAEQQADQKKSAPTTEPAGQDAAAKPKKEAQDEQKDDTSISRFMQQKLTISNRILKGLMTDDLSLVEDGADKLLKMSHEERWRASNDMMYLQHSNQFRNAAEDLRTKAGKGTIDGASLAWINVTMSCIQCHQWVRNIVVADVQNVR